MKEPIKTIKERLFAEEVDPAYVAQLMADERSGVQKLIAQVSKSAAKTATNARKICRDVGL
jgi:ribonuclease HII